MSTYEPGHDPGPRTQRITDPGQAEAVVGDVYLPHRLDLSRGDGPLALELRSGRVGSMTVSRLAYGRRVRLRTGDIRNFHVHVTLSGRSAARVGAGPARATRPWEALVLSPGAPAEIACSADCVQLWLKIPRARLEDQLGRVLGRPVRQPLLFDFGTVIDGSRGAGWRMVVGLLVEELARPSGVLAHDVMAGHVEGMVMDSLLIGHPHNHSHALDPGGHVPRAAIRRAVDLVEDSPQAPWTTSELARQVHLSTRALQNGFTRDLGMPPMRYLRQVRLQRAHALLTCGSPDRTTVQAVAHSLGFEHMGRFAQEYRQAYGELPSYTLGRVRV